MSTSLLHPRAAWGRPLDLPRQETGLLITQSAAILWAALLSQAPHRHRVRQIRFLPLRRAHGLGGVRVGEQCDKSANGRQLQEGLSPRGGAGRCVSRSGVGRMTQSSQTSSRRDGGPVSHWAREPPGAWPAGRAEEHGSNCVNPGSPSSHQREQVPCLLHASPLHL